MKQSAFLAFESTAFVVIPGEDEETNPGIFGKSLAQWIAAQLATRGFPVGEVIAEDFGWCVPLVSKSPRLFVACASEDEKPTQWRVFAFAEGSAFARIFGKDKSAESLASLFSALKQTLQSTPSIKGLREEPA